MKTYLFSKLSFLIDKLFRSLVLSLMFLLLGVQGFGQSTYTLITSTSDLVAGSKYLVVSTNVAGNSQALGYQNTNNRPKADVTVVNTSGIITVTTTPATDNTDTTHAYELTLGGSPDSWTLYDSLNNGYLYAASNSANYLRTKSTTSTWTIAFSNGAAVLTSNEQVSRNILRYNNVRGLFSCYSTGQASVYLYKLNPSGKTVTFKGNGATGGGTGGTGGDYTQTASAPTALIANTFTRTGYTFSKWNTQADGSGTDYANGATYPFSADATLYAQWAAPNDTTSQVNGPVLASQPAAANISSLATTTAAAVKVFDFNVVDAGTADGLPTNVTQITVKPGSNNTAAWSSTIGGVRLYDGASEITPTSTNITDAGIVLTFSTPIAVANNSTKTLSLYTYLKSSGLVDKGVLEFNIPTASHGFVANASGSTFAGTFTSATTSNQFTVSVVASQLRFTTQPSATACPTTNLATPPAVTATDANGNKDLDFASQVTVSNSGSLGMLNYAVNATSGIATFTNLQFTALGSATLTAGATGLTSSSASSSITISVPTVSGAAATNGNAQSSVSWANPSSCYDEIMIVAKQGSAAGTIPSGDGSAYTASLVFGGGTAFDGGYVVYKGTSSPQTISNLANGSTYHFTYFTRKGSLWSSGVSTSATPSFSTSATDYFRSKSSGNWASAGSWESSSDNTNWITATSAPTSAANTITIRSGHTITVDSTVTIDQVVIAGGGQMVVNSTTAVLNINDGTGHDIDVQSGGVLQVKEGKSYASTIVFVDSSSMNVSGKILVGDGSNVSGFSGYGNFGYAAASQIIWNDAAVLEWNTTGSAPETSGITYFPGASIGTIPVFKITAIAGGNIGGGSPTIINGLLQLNGVNIMWQGDGKKTFRNGVTAVGTASMAISGGTGSWQIGDDSLSGNAEIGGSGGSLTLGNTNGLSVTAGCLATLTSNVTLSSGTLTNRGTIDFGTNVLSGSGGFTQAADATIITANTGGVPGSVAVTTKTFSAEGANYTFNGATTTPFITVTGASTTFATVNVNANVTNNISTTSTTVKTALNINNGGTFVASNDLNLSNADGALNIAAGGTYDNGGEKIVTSSGGTPTIAINGTFITRDKEGFTGPNTAIPGITPTLGDNSTVVYGLSGDQAVTDFAYKNLRFSGSGTKTTGTITSITGTVTINPGVTVDAGNRTFGGTDTNLIINGNGIFKTGGSGTKPDAGGTYTLANTSTIEFGESAVTNIRVEPTYGNINVTGSNVNLSGPTTSLTLQTGSAFTVKSGGTFHVKNVDGLSGSATTAINNTNSPSVVLEQGSTINYDGTDQIVTTAPVYSRLAVSTAGLKTANAALTVNNNLDITAGTLALKASAGNNLNIGGVMTIASGATFDNNGENQVVGAGSIVNNGTFITRDAQGFSGTDAAIPAITNITLGDGSTVHYALAGNQAVSTRTDYKNLLFTGNGTKTVAGNITPIAGTVTIDGANTIVDVKTNTFGSEATNLTMTAGSLILGGAGLKPDMGGTYSLAAGSTIEYTGAPTQIRTTPLYAKVVVSGSNVVGGTTDTDGLSFGPNGVFTVKSGAKFNVNNTDGFSGGSISAIQNTNNPIIILEPGSTIDYTGTDQTISNFIPYENLKISTAGTKSQQASLTVNNLTTVSAGTLKILKTIESANANVLYAHKGIQNTGGSVVFENNAQLMQDADAVNTGNIQSQRDVVQINNDLATQMDYVYWSSPVAGQATTGSAGFSPGTPANRFFEYREYNDSFVGTADPTFKVGKGYAVRAESGLSNPYDKTYSFTGLPNNGAQQFANLKYTDASHGYNLVGNPYPSNINFDLLFGLNSTKIYSTAFFWTNNSYTAFQAGSDYDGNNYAVYNGSGGSPATYNPSNPYNGSMVPNGIIKVGQAFIVQAKSDGKDLPLDFDNSIRVTAGGGFFQKSDTIKNRFWLEMAAPNNLVNTILVGYIPGATNNYEVDYDAELFVVGSDSFYSILGAKKLAIQGRAHTFGTSDVVPLGNVYAANGNYTIGLKNPEGIFSSGQTVYLKDKLLNKIVNLTNGSYSFQAVKGTDNTRFEIVYKDDLVLGTNGATKSDFVVYRDGAYFVIQSAHTLGKVELYDASGRMVLTTFSKDKTTRIDASVLANGVYIIKAENSGKLRTRKIIK
ncbi:T9SS type A sorting domain-containing protein [Chryseobacterium sp. SC28]|uniref:T9SS type A sorting domain-containing protein n=1 Tax=Chryseobacterium sp. SC28 TaxID=2268028 RepID=UPI000F646DF9|nr:T9SS type A sorting domain-containing protein [Chryseobacterium sp. SC28]RRQ45030.1 T9SS C-terminal target domain-containing protein [Chryseobacterium sp. SC28]